MCVVVPSVGMLLASIIALFVRTLASCITTVLDKVAILVASIATLPTNSNPTLFASNLIPAITTRLAGITKLVANITVLHR